MKFMQNIMAMLPSPGIVLGHCHLKQTMTIDFTSLGVTTAITLLIVRNALTVARVALESSFLNEMVS